MVAVILAIYVWLAPRLPAAVALVTLVYRIVRTGSGEPRWGWAMLATSFVIAGPILIARFNTPPPVGVGLYVCHRFHLLGVVLLAVPSAVGIDQSGSAATST